MAINRMIILDKLLGAIIPDRYMDQLAGEDIDLNFYQVLFTFWLRHVCNSGRTPFKLSLDEAKSAFRILRTGETSPPFKMARSRDEFIKGLIDLMQISGDDNVSFIEETLSMIWDEFADEYAMINTDDLEPRYSGFVLIGE